MKTSDFSRLKLDQRNVPFVLLFAADITVEALKFRMFIKSRCDGGRDEIVQ